MFKVTLKGLRARKFRFALTALAVLLGVAFMAGTLVLTDTLERTFDELFADVNEGTDIYVRSAESLEQDFGPDQRERISGDLVPTIEAVDGVEAVEGDVEFYAQIVDRDGEEIGDPSSGPPTLGFNWREVEELNPNRVQPGGHPPATPDEVVIDKKSADDAGFEVGDTVTVLTQSAPKQYELVGVAKFGDADSQAGATVAFLTTAEAQRIVGAENQLDAIAAVAEDGVSQDELRERVRAALDDPGLEVLTGEEITEEDQNEIQDALAFIRTPLLVFAGIALLVGAFIIFNTFSIVVAQRIREMALLRAIGSSQAQVMTAVVGEALAVGVLASLAGLLGGIGLSVLLKSAMAAFGFDIPSGGVVVAPSTIVISLSVGSVITVVSALFPAWRASRVPPVAAIRDVAIERAGGLTRRLLVGLVIFVAGVVLLGLGLFGDVDQPLYAVGFGAVGVIVGVTVIVPAFARSLSRAIGWPVARLRGMTGRLARENAMRNPRRTAATAAALMIGVAVVGFFTVFASSAKATVNTQVDRLFSADYVIGGGFGFGTIGGFSPDLSVAVADLPEVETASPVRFNGAEIDGGNTFLFGADPATVGEVFDLDTAAGAVEDLTDGIAVSERVANREDWELGTMVPVRFPNGERELAIQTIFRNGQREGLADYGISLATYDAGYTEHLDTQLYVQLAPGVSPERGREVLEQAAEPYPNAEVEDLTEFKESFSEQVNQMLALVTVLIVLALVIALVGIANTLALSIYERTREIGLLRSVGMSRRQLRSAIRWESVIIAVLGTLLGLILGVLFGWAVVRALRDQGFETFDASAGQLALVVVLAGIAGVVAAALPARRAAKLDVLRAISSE